MPKSDTLFFVFCDFVSAGNERLCQPGVGEALGVSAIERRSLSDEQISLLNRAIEDFRLVDANKPPKHAILKWVLRDGGTKIYEGEGYSLVSHYGRLSRQGGFDGRESGATMTLTRRITGEGEKLISTKKLILQDNN